MTAVYSQSRYVMAGSGVQKRVAHSWASVQLSSPLEEKEINNISKTEHHPLLLGGGGDIFSSWM